MKRLIGRLRCNQRGATVVEYGFIIALVVIAVMAALGSFADASGEIWGNVSARVTGAR